MASLDFLQRLIAISKSNIERMTRLNIRVPTSADLPQIAHILQDTELFPAEMLEEMIQPFLSGVADNDRWLICEDDQHGVIGFSFARLEQLTEGTWHLLAIGFRSAHQRDGLGGKLLEAVESALDGQRILIIETSSLDGYADTRGFYSSRGYTQEAVIRDYWAAGDHKIIFRKAHNDIANGLVEKPEENYKKRPKGEQRFHNL